MEQKPDYKALLEALVAAGETMQLNSRAVHANHPVTGEALPRVFVPRGEDYAAFCANLHETKKALDAANRIHTMEGDHETQSW